MVSKAFSFVNDFNTVSGESGGGSEMGKGLRAEGMGQDA
jgi:hypothetical protein